MIINCLSLIKKGQEVLENLKLFSFHTRKDPDKDHIFLFIILDEIKYWEDYLALLHKPVVTFRWIWHKKLWKLCENRCLILRYYIYSIFYIYSYILFYGNYFCSQQNYYNCSNADKIKRFWYITLLNGCCIINLLLSFFF